jgi:hypothetical protein
MGVSITFKVVLPKRDFTSRRWVEEIARAQRQFSVPKLRDLFQQTTFGWSKKPDFGWSQTVKPDSVSLTIYASGQYADIYNLVNAGSPAHGIDPRNGGWLSFRTGYRSATTPGVLMGRRAYRSGPYVAARHVNHPGFTPRNFYQRIGEAFINQGYAADMQSAVSVAARG